MNKKNLLILSAFVVTTIISATAFSISTFDKNPTSASDDRRQATEATLKTAQLMQQLLEENQKTNQLLAELIVETKRRK